MNRTLLPLTAFLLIAACQKPDVRLKVLLGATTIIAPGAPPIDDSIIVIAGNKIRTVGKRQDVPVPQASDRTDLSGKWVVPLEGARIAAGQIANLVILKHAPVRGIEPASAGDVSSRIQAGEWQLVSTRP